jgi:AbrB family looped-hinge helix DNA binding protein
MKATATITSKGQITIPQVVRQLLGLQAGDAVEFEVEKGRAEVRPARPKRTSSGVLNRYLPKNWKPPTVEQMEAGIAANLAQKHRHK